MPVILYKRQRQILDYIKQYIERYGFSPTLADIAEAIGVNSLATVHEHLQALVQKGVIKKYEGTVRGLEVIDQKVSDILKGVELPLLGYIAAGQPLMAYTDPNASVGIPPTMVSGKKRAYVLQVKGDSMIEDGILDGDYVIIEEQDSAMNGEIVVALLDNGLATLKRFFKEPGRVRLEPANAAMEPIYVTDPDSFRIQGKCVGVIRRFN